MQGVPFDAHRLPMGVLAERSAGSDTSAQPVRESEDPGDGGLDILGTALLFEKLNSRCSCERGHPSRECRRRPLMRWWRGTDKPWEGAATADARAKLRNDVQSHPIARAMARLLNDRNGRPNTLAKAFVALKRAVFARYGTECARCHAAVAKWLVKRPSPGIPLGGVCSKCKSRHNYDVITWKRIANGDVGMYDLEMA